MPQRHYLVAKTRRSVLRRRDSPRLVATVTVAAGDADVRRDLRVEPPDEDLRWEKQVLNYFNLSIKPRTYHILITKMYVVWIDP